MTFADTRSILWRQWAHIWPNVVYRVWAQASAASGGSSGKVSEQSESNQHLELTKRLFNGQISRRSFIRQAVVLGISTPAIFAAIEACTPAAQTATGKKAQLVIALDSDIDTLDPNDFKSDGGYLSVAQVYETPVTSELKAAANGALVATGNMIPMVASSFTVSSDTTTYTFKLRPNVKFSNGNVVTADTLVYSLRRALLRPGVSSFMMSLLGIKDPSQFTAVDSQTLQINLGAPNPMATRILPLTILPIIDPATTQAQATTADPWAGKFYQTKMLGTGPYIQGQTWQSGSQYQFSPNPLYWDPTKVKNSGVLARYVPAPEDRMLLLQRGDVDLAFSLPSSNLASLKSDSSLKIWQFPVPNVNYMAMNQIIKPFDDVRVRQAIAWAMPYDTFVPNVLHGFGRPIQSIIPEGMPTFKDTYSYTTDTAKAQSLLQAAGLGSGFSTTLGVSVSRAEDQDAAVWIQSSLAKIGIQVEIDKLSDADFRKKQAADGLPMFLDYWYSWVNDPYYQLYFLLYSKAAGTNLTHYNNPEVDQLIDTGRYNPDPVQREAGSQRIQQIFAQEVPRVLLYSQDFVVATRKEVSGVNVYPDQLLRFWELAKG